MLLSFSIFAICAFSVTLASDIEDLATQKNEMTFEDICISNPANPGIFEQNLKFVGYRPRSGTLPTVALEKNLRMIFSLYSSPELVNEICHKLNKDHFKKQIAKYLRRNMLQFVGRR